MANPNNMNFLSPHNFELIIERLPDLTYFVQAANIPDLILGQAVAGSPFSQIPIPGDTIVFGSLEVTFKVNEDMSNWSELYQWVKQIGFPESFADRTSIDATIPGFDLTCDASLIIRTNANNPNKKITFKNLFPIALGGLNFDVTTTDVAEVTTTASFRFGTYDISDA